MHIVEKATPPVQFIPFRCADFDVDTEIRAETADAAAERYRNTLAGAGWRRKFARGRA